MNGRKENSTAGSKDWKTLETNNKTSNLNVFFLPRTSSEKVRQAYISKHNSEHSLYQSQKKMKTSRQ